MGARQIRVWMDPAASPPELERPRIHARHRPEVTVLMGFVVDEQTGRPMPDVLVSGGAGFDHDALQRVWGETRTDARGFFSLDAPCALQPEAGRVPIALVFAKPGYRTQVNRNLELWPGGDWTYRVRLSSGPAGRRHCH